MAEKVVIGNAELWHGDCREVLPLLPPSVVIVSDPPYGIGYVKGHGGRPGTGYSKSQAERTRNSAPIIGDDEPFKPGHLLTFEQAILFGADHYAQELPRGRWLAWDKLGGQDSYGDSFSDVEYAWHSKTGAARIFRMVWKGMCQGAGKDKGTRRTHPTQKPIDLMTWCIDKVAHAQTVCDPFMGSGSTGVACAMLGRAFTGVERERRYFDIACERISRAHAQGQLLPHEPPARPEQQGMAFEP